MLLGRVFYFCAVFRIELYLSLIIILGCSGEETRKAQKALREKKQAKKEQKVVEINKPEVRQASNYITDETVIKRLTKYGEENPETIVDIHTTKGKIRIKLYEDTPLHRANFIMMAKEGFYKGTVFTRVVKGFMAQGGGTNGDEQAMIKRRIGNFSIPAEFRPNRYHKNGAVGAARGYDNNPEMRSNPYAFYMVEGTKYTNKVLDYYEIENKYKYPSDHREYYLNNPGAAHIDQLHTVFGEIIEGIEIVPKLTSVATDSRDWPLTDIFITKVEVIE